VGPGEEAIVSDRTRMEVLARDECLRLLRTLTVGRVGLSIEALPVVLPVNFVVADDAIVFRTSPGSKLDDATRDMVVAFQGDHIDADAQSGWSVLVTGVASEVRDPAEIAALRRLELGSWVPGDPDHFVRIPATLVNGRRISVASPTQGADREETDVSDVGAAPETEG
jgi:nitroimidazol reductase NimA-like FMN-containing flavoprotein (pyridoxamine 5'-phosphate oxidase superfamily)